MARALAKRSSLLRIHRIDHLLRVPQAPSLDHLATELEVSRRTVARDLELMRLALKAPIVFDRAVKGYRYSHDGFQLPSIRLTEGELVSLFIAEEAVKQYRNTPFGPDLESAFGKIVDSLPDEVTLDLSWWGKALSFRPGSLREQDLETFRRITRGIRERRVLRIRYHTLSRDEVGRREVDPYHLANVQGDWYMLAFCRKRGAVRIFLCARILDLEFTGDRFEEPEDFSAREFLAGAFSIQKGGKPRNVKIRFSHPAALYVRERTWHPSQKVRELDGGGIELRLSVESLDEVKRWVLSWGGGAEVLSPRSLRESVAREADAMALRYR